MKSDERNHNLYIIQANDGCRLDKMDTYPLTKLEQSKNYAASKHEPETGEYVFNFEDRKEIAYILVMVMTRKWAGGRE